MQSMNPNASPQRFDLHCHSTASDGVLSPQEILERADAQGVALLAITDHDTVAGVRALLDADFAVGTALLPGIELTCTDGQRVLHLVGLGIDVDDGTLGQHLDTLIATRMERADSILDQLRKRRLPLEWSQVEAAAGGAPPGRVHFARVLVECGAADSVSQAFKRYLADGKLRLGNTPWPSLDSAVAAIIGAGGVAVLAHPRHYNLTRTRALALLRRFVSAGGEAIEVISGANSPLNDIQRWSRTADELGLLVSAGSDFHAPSSWCELGKFPSLPGCNAPVWEHPKLHRWVDAEVGRLVCGAAFAEMGRSHAADERNNA
ncbi:MAG: PHP domain-containing protein [Pseudomonadota bacterium]|nr:PHP domain-containing protein [Pseudomonadota bacterium]